MRNKFVVTMSTVRRTRVIRAHRVLLALGVLLMLLFVGGFIGGWHYSHYLAIKQMEIKNDYAEMVQKYNNVVSYNLGLSEELSSLSRELIDQAEMVQKINAIEQVLGKKKTNDIFASPVLVSFDTYRANRNVLDSIDNELGRKIKVLYALPSGSPLARDTYISSGYGRRRHPIYGRLHFHTGLDLPLRIGDKVVSTADGTVIFTGSRTGYGKTVMMSHSYGFRTIYSHLDKILVKTGDVVAKGDVIADGGNTGISTGPHLHYEIRYLGKVINPYRFYNWNLVNFDTIFKAGIEVNWQSILTAIDRSLQIQQPQLSLKEQN